MCQADCGDFTRKTDTLAALEQFTVSKGSEHINEQSAGCNKGIKRALCLALWDPEKFPGK